VRPPAVLIIDDEPLIRLSMEDALRAVGCEVRAAATAMTTKKPIVTTMLSTLADRIVAAVKRAVHDGLDRPLADGLQAELGQLAPLFASEDAREGMVAFTEKRPAKYAGR